MAMEIRIPSPVSVIRSSESVFKTRVSINPNPNPLQSSRGRRSRTQLLIRDSRFSTRIREVDEAVSTVDPVRAEITWQIVIGALAGITPFLIAGIEFGKRIVAQRRCGVCGGSGLVLRDQYYFRCPGCGGFLPWKSWKRFFLG